MPINLRQQALAGLDSAGKAWRLYVQHGLTQPQIAIELGLSKSAVSRAIARAERHGLAALKTSIARHKALQLERLERIYALAMDGFERSAREKVRKGSKSKGVGDAQVRSAEVKTEETIGDPRWLSEARAALADMRKLLGLDAPAKVQLVDPDRPYGGLSDDDVHAELRAMLARAGVDLASLADGDPVIDVTPRPHVESARPQVVAAPAVAAPMLALGPMDTGQQTCRVCGCLDEAAVVWTAADLCARCARST